MPIDVLANNAQTTLTVAVTTTPVAGTAETWTVASTAPPFPVLASGQQFRAVVGSYTDVMPEIVIVTTIGSSTQFTVIRGAEGSPIKTHSVGDLIILTLSAALVDPALGVVHFRAYRAAGWSATGGYALTPVLYDTISWNVGGGGTYSSATGLFTCSIAGYYHTIGTMACIANAVNTNQIYLERNGVSGATSVLLGAQNSNIMACTVTDELHLSVGDTVGVSYQTNSTGSGQTGSNTFLSLSYTGKY